MRLNKTLSLAAFAGALALTPLHADEWNKKTTITINAPVQIPSTTLQPGTYTLKLMDSSSDRHIVTVWDKDGMHLITTVLAIPNYRLKPTDASKFTFWETPAGEPAAMRAWFYPGDNFGQEFAYPKNKAQAITTAGNANVPTLSADEENKYGNQGNGMTKSTESSATAETATATATPSPAPLTTEATSPEPTPAPAPVAAAPAPEPAPAPAPTAAAEAPAPPAPSAEEQAPASPAPAAMPETASNWNETMSLGFLLGLTGLSTFLVKRKRIQ